MLSRHQRRAFARRHKRTHKIELDTCILWIPEACAFLAGFSRDSFTVTNSPHFAQQFCEHVAPSAALTVRELFGVRCAIRKHYAPTSNADASLAPRLALSSQIEH